MGKAASVISTVASIASMASGAPINPLSMILSVANTFAGLAGKDKSADKAAASYDAQAEQMRKAQEIEDENRRERARRQIATERASMAARGIDTESGSGEALLTGIASDSEKGVDQSNALLDLRLDDLNRRKQNLLDAARDSQDSAMLGTAMKGVSSLGRILSQGPGGSSISLLGD